MQEIIFGVLSLIIGPVGAIGFLIFAFMLWWYGDQISAPVSLQRQIDVAKSEKWRGHYADTLTRWLNGIDRWLIPDHDGRDSTLAARAWNWRLYSLCMGVAILYPVLSLFGSWIVMGDAGRLGTIEALPAESDRLQRLAAAILSTGMTWAAYKFTKIFTYQRFIYLSISFVCFTVLMKYFEPVAIAFAVIGSVTIAVTIAVAAVSAIFGAVSGLVPATIAFAFAGAFTGVVAVIFVGAFAGPFAGAGAFAFGVSVGIAGSIAVILSMTYLIERSKWGSMGTFLSLGIFMTITVIVLVQFGESKDINAKILTLVLFFGLLPYVNAWFDYLSLGLTRYCLRRGLAPGGRMWLWSLLDLAGAIMMFFTLGAATLAVLHFLRFSDGPPLCNVPALFTDLKTHPGDYWWLYITLFSTLLPTALHFGAMLFSWISFARPGLGPWLASQLEQAPHDRSAYRKAQTVLSLIMFTAYVAPVIALYWVGVAIWGNWDAIAFGVLWVFETFAQAIGAV